MNYEEMQIEHGDLNIREIDLSGVDGLKGLYTDGNIAIDQNIPTAIERACVLAEELGHHYTTVGNILDQSDSSNRKQEHRARMWAYNHMIGLLGLIECYKAGCQNRYESAEHLGVTEEFLQEALNAYRRQYGQCVQVDDYVIYFEPYYGIAKTL